MTTGDTGKQMNQLRELIDAGVFVFTGGRPRTKTKDSDPILQFKLSFRRIYGLTNYIGLAERDRFELSGAGLEEWLSDPGKGKDVLLRNLGGPLDEEEEAETQAALAEPTPVTSAEASERTPTLFDQLKTAQKPLSAEAKQQQNIKVKALTANEAAKFGAASIVLGLGFEDRTLESARKLTRVLAPSKVFAVQYEEKGKSKQILKLLETWGATIELIPYEKAISEDIPVSEGAALIDVTGLAKPVIFHAVRRSLHDAGLVLIAHTRAKRYYPTEADMTTLLKAETQSSKVLRRPFAHSDRRTGSIGSKSWRPQAILPAIAWRGISPKLRPRITQART